MSHTNAVLPVSQRTFDEIKSKLQEAGYSGSIVNDNYIDMHGLAVQPIPEEPHKLRIAGVDVEIQ
jgi:hypothetical protein